MTCFLNFVIAPPIRPIATFDMGVATVPCKTQKSAYYEVRNIRAHFRENPQKYIESLKKENKTYHNNNNETQPQNVNSLLRLFLLSNSFWV